MDPAAYRSLRDLQDRHWWFVARRRIIGQLIEKVVKPRKQPRILEAGCGYGGNLPLLEQFGEVDAFECDPGARAYASKIMKRPVQPGMLPADVGFDNQAFDVIAMLDVLEHIDDDVGSLASLRERLAAGGAILLTVPALPWLWSDHDLIHHHKRRYTKHGLSAVLREAGLEPICVGYFNFLLFPLAAAQRLFSRLLGKNHQGDVMPSRLVNTVLRKLFSFEKHLIGKIRMPIGLSLYAVARSAQA